MRSDADQMLAAMHDELADGHFLKGNEAGCMKHMEETHKAMGL